MLLRSIFKALHIFEKLVVELLSPQREHRTVKKEWNLASYLILEDFTGPHCSGLGHCCRLVLGILQVKVGNFEGERPFNTPYWQGSRAFPPEN